MIEYEGFDNVYEVTHFWEAIDENPDEALRVGASGETTSECYSNSLKNAKEVANSHGWESVKASVIRQSLGIEDIKLIKVEVKLKNTTNE